MDRLLRNFMALLGLFMIVSGPVAAQSPVPAWTSSDISRLKAWISAAPEDALPGFLLAE